jgi:hypothetical protein
MPRRDYCDDAPSEYDQIENARRLLGDVFFECMQQSIRDKWPLRCPKTFWAMLWLSKGQSSFITSVGKVMVFSRQSKATVIRALDDLDEAGWIARQRRINPLGTWWINSRYYIYHLLPQNV